MLLVLTLYFVSCGSDFENTLNISADISRSLIYWYCHFIQLINEKKKWEKHTLTMIDNDALV